jgi:nitrite reductase/ring-hydroxylating ferredoxin subunit
MPEFVTVATVEEIPPGTGRTVEVQGVWIALFNVDGSFYAIDNTCPHAGGPLGEGLWRATSSNVRGTDGDLTYKPANDRRIRTSPSPAVPYGSKETRFR